MSDKLNLIQEWLEKHLQKTILIRKEEQGDLDETRVLLEGVEYKENVSTIDDYAEGSSLILHGPGKVLNEQGDIPLPQNTFQIYVDGLADCQAGEDGITMKTDRAKYFISEIS
ncbi:hypothetical protein GRF59_06000 [Paenibacillus sp. HJL G12]|uniref:Uncharacterized protein n=1 Tax=Paenibacillus dendrobii TaxID=2691084 RepID=A0A7X3LH46_9BACL|nr:hypothetical protein [Paenibacillus dendrobii]MWV43178.1 hypothetical protein [Paenibacillus dendrobii]